LEDNEPSYSYHGYAQSDYYKIDPRYGTNEDYKNLADELHKRKMKLVMDYVTNHWGSKLDYQRFAFKRLDSLLERTGKWFPKE
jgi:glycosidase